MPVGGFQFILDIKNQHFDALWFVPETFELEVNVVEYGVQGCNPGKILESSITVGAFQGILRETRRLSIL